jgi:hypothetical protein
MGRKRINPGKPMSVRVMRRDTGKHLSKGRK